MARASRSKRCFRSGLSDRCDGRTLIATVRSRRVSRARYTSPMPPAPSAPVISYGPSFVPGETDMRGVGGFYHHSSRQSRRSLQHELLVELRERGQGLICIGEFFSSRDRLLHRRDHECAPWEERRLRAAGRSLAVRFFFGARSPETSAPKRVGMPAIRSTMASSIASGRIFGSVVSSFASFPTRYRVRGLAAVSA